MDVNNISTSQVKLGTEKKHGIFSWFTKKDQSDDQISQKRLVLMWALMFVGYFMFCLQWYSISNFSGGWGQAFFEDGQSTLVSSVPNWMITFGRSIGSILAGFFIAKFGHKYAVVFCLTLMVISFPYIIVAQNQSWNSLSIKGGASQVIDHGKGTAVAGFSLFVIFRIFLAVGGTTLITYTNSVIAKMPAEKRSSFITLNSFGFNGGAFFGSIFFVCKWVRSEVAKPEIWTSILSVFIVLIFFILIAYLIFGVEVVPKQLKSTKNFSEKNEITFRSVLAKKENYVLYYMFFVWLLAVVFINGSGFRNFIEQSPANAQVLVNYSVSNNKLFKSLSSTSYGWVWPAYISVFVLGYVVSAFTITKFNLTFFRRKEYAAIIITLGLAFAFIGLLTVYFAGYENIGAVAMFLILTFISGIFLWGAQPVLLFIPQQQEGTNPKYVGIVAGLVWGFGYLGYTVGDASLSSIATYVGDTNAFTNAVANAYNSSSHKVIEYSSVSSGLIVMFALFWIIMGLGIFALFFLPDTGTMKDGKFVKFTKVWNPFKLSNYNFYSPSNRY